MPSKTLSVLGLLLICASLQAGDARPRIIDGTNVPASQFPTVGEIGDGLLGFDEFYCSGTLISPRHVLCAGHCVCDSGGIPIVSGDAGRFRLGGVTYKTRRILVHPTFKGDISFLTEGNFDVSIWELDQPVPGVTPTNLFRARAPVVGDVVTIAGYGLVGNGDTGIGDTSQTPPPGTIEFGTTPLESVTPTFIKWQFDDVPPPNNEANTSPGDSGGPAFINNAGNLEVIAVTTGGSRFDAAFGDNSFDTRIDPIFPWIDRITNGLPDHDPFNEARPLFGTFVQTLDFNVGASKESGEPNHGGNAGGASVWYSWTAPVSGQVTISTAGSEFDTLLAVYQGKAVNALTLVAENNDDTSGASPLTTSAVTFMAVGGKTYHIAVDGNNGATGAIRMSLSEAGQADLVISSIESDPLNPVPGEDVTFIVTVYNQGTADAQCNVNFWQNLPAAPTLSTFPEQAQFTILPAGEKDILFFDVTAPANASNPTAWAFIDSYLGTSEVAESNEGNNFLSYSWFVDRALINDNFASAIELPPGDAFSTATNANATKEPGEPNHAGKPGGRSIWWKWRAEAGGPTEVDTDGSTFDTLLAVYTGNSVSALTPIASNDDHDGNLTSHVTFNAVAGKTYYFAVDGVNKAYGRVQLSVTGADANDLEIKRAQIHFDFKKQKKDSLSLQASVSLQPSFTAVTSRPCSLIIGDFRRDFTIDARNKSSDKGIRLMAGRDGSARITVNLHDLDLLTALSGLGFLNSTVKDQPIDVPVTFILAQDSYVTTVTLNYTAKQDKTGIAK